MFPLKPTVLHIGVTPLLNVTVPVGLLPPVIVAVNVTELPTMLGFALDANPVVGVA